MNTRNAEHLTQHTHDKASDQWSSGALFNLHVLAATALAACCLICNYEGACLFKGCTASEDFCAGAGVSINTHGCPKIQRPPYA